MGELTNEDLHEPFRGSEAVAAGTITYRRLRGTSLRRVFRDVYVPAATRMTHEMRCRSAALILPPDAVITGRSAATVRGVPLAQPADPVEIVVGLDTRIFRRAGLDAFPERRLAVEYDGAWHGDLLHVGPDRERLNQLQAAGWDVVFVTAQLLREPRRMVSTVRSALTAR